MGRPEDSDLKYAAFFAHLGLLFGFLAVILILTGVLQNLSFQNAYQGPLAWALNHVGYRLRVRGNDSSLAANVDAFED